MVKTVTQDDAPVWSDATCRLRLGTVPAMTVLEITGRLVAKRVLFYRVAGLPHLRSKQHPECWMASSAFAGLAERPPKQAEPTVSDLEYLVARKVVRRWEQQRGE